jgi:broad specificity phosphatase PhoE
MSIHILRHGKTVANEHNESAEAGNRFFGGQSETPMTLEGVRQIKQLGLRYMQQRISFARVFSSPAGRATTGAETLLNEMGLAVPIEPIEALAERASGVIAGKTRDQLLAEQPEFEVHLRRDPQLRHLRESFEPSGIPGFEDYGAVVQRLRTGAIPLLRSADGATEEQSYELIALEDDVGEYDRVLAVTHKHTTRCLLYALLDLTKEQAIRLEVPNAQPFVLRKRA